MLDGLLKTLVQKNTPIFFPYVCSIAIKLNQIQYLIDNFPKVDDLFKSKENQFFMAYLIVETENRDLYKLFDITYGGNLIKQIIVVSYLKGKDPERIVSHFLGYHLDNPFKNDWTEEQIKGFVDAINVFMFTQFKPYSVIQERSIYINRNMPLLKGVTPPKIDIYVPPKPKPALKPKEQTQTASKPEPQPQTQADQPPDGVPKKVIKKRIVKKVIVKKKIVKKNPEETTTAAEVPNEEQLPQDEQPNPESPQEIQTPDNEEEKKEEELITKDILKNEEDKKEESAPPEVENLVKEAQKAEEDKKEEENKPNEEFNQGD